MKKFLLVFAMIFAGFALFTAPLYAAEGDPVDEPIIEEVVDDELTLEEDDELTLEEEEALFQAELNATLAAVFAWIGGFSGLAALAAFALRFIRERGLLKSIRDEIAKAKESGDNSAMAVNNLVEVVQAYSAREQAMEKMVVGLIQVSDLHPEAKRQVIEGLQNDSITVQEVFAAGLVQVDAEVQQNEQLKSEIKQTTASLLSKLAEKDNV